MTQPTPQTINMLFSGPMVYSLLNDLKHQTRRGIRLPPVASSRGGWEAGTIGGPDACLSDGTAAPGMAAIWHTHTGCCIASPYTVGDIIRVRETFWHWGIRTRHEATAAKQGHYTFKAMGQHIIPVVDCYHKPTTRPTDDSGGKWVKRPALFMPKEASRLFLEITGVRAERVQAISIADAIDEGLSKINKTRTLYKYGIPDLDGMWGNDNYGWHWHEWEVDPRKAFEKLWTSINGPTGPQSWPGNPWNWVINFKVVQPSNA